MKLFRCQACDNIVYFENRTCGRCGRRPGYVPELGVMSALDPAGDPDWTLVGGDAAPRRLSANASHDVCNRLVPAASPDRLCRACRHNDTIPHLSNADHVAAWREMEFAKHRLFYSLLRWRLPLETRAENPAHGLAFEFLADPPDPSAPRVITSGACGGRNAAAAASEDGRRASVPVCSDANAVTGLSREAGSEGLSPHSRR